LSELKSLVRSWYGCDCFDDFDLRGQKNIDEDHIRLLKKTGLVCNYFYAYKEGDNFFLLDGFNRLLTSYAEIVEDVVVYLKIIVEKLEDNELMSVMLMLNMWKLSKTHHGGFDTQNFFDRGMRLLLFKKFGIKIYHSLGDKEHYNSRIRNNNDFDVLDNYFINEMGFAGYFKLDLKDVMKLLSNKNIIVDLKEIIDSNNYLKPPFSKYDKFLNGFVMFLSRQRLKKDDSEYRFKNFIKKLEADKKFFNKLEKMSWTDSTRKNIYNWYQQIENKETD
jgi:hypothetical protein